MLKQLQMVCRFSAGKIPAYRMCCCLARTDIPIPLLQSFYMQFAS